MFVEFACTDTIISEPRLVGSTTVWSSAYSIYEVMMVCVNYFVGGRRSAGFPVYVG